MQADIHFQSATDLFKLAADMLRETTGQLKSIEARVKKAAEVRRR